MSIQEKLQLLKNYKEALIYASGYETKEEKELEKKQPRKVLVLKRKWYGQDKKVA